MTFGGGKCKNIKDILLFEGISSAAMGCNNCKICWNQDFYNVFLWLFGSTVHQALWGGNIKILEELVLLDGS